MDHTHILERNIADLYVLGKLPLQDREEFEAHFMECVQCLDLLEEIQSTRQALKKAGARAIAKSSVRGVRGPAAWLSTWDPLGQLAVLAVAVLLLGSLPIGYLVMRINRLRQQLDQASTTRRADMNRLLPANEAGPPMPNQNRNGNAAVSVRSGKDDIAPSNNRRHLAGLAPEVNTPIFVLSSLRRASPDDATPPNDFSVPATARLFVVAVELESEVRYRTYRAEVLKANVRIWTSDHLRPNQSNALTMSFPSRFLTSGKYVLVLEGVDEKGSRRPVAEYLFRLTVKE